MPGIGQTSVPVPRAGPSRPWPNERNQKQLEQKDANPRADKCPVRLGGSTSKEHRSPWEGTAMPDIEDGPQNR